MDTSRTRRITTQIAALLVAVMLGALLVPPGVNAANDSFVKIRDFKNTTNNGKARVVRNRLLVGDGQGPLTVDGSVKASVSGTVTARPPAPTVHTTRCEGSSAANNGSCTMTVPAGRRFVIETVSVALDLPANQTATAALRITTGGVVSTFYVPVVRQHTYASGSRHFHVASDPAMVLRADPGTTVTALFSRDTSGLMPFTVVLAGHLE